MKHPIRRRIIYLAFQGLRLLVAALPLAAARLLGKAAGAAAFAAAIGQRRLTLRHLEAVFGESMSAARRRAVAWRLFLNLGQNAAEWLKLPQWTAADLQRLVSGEGIEHLRAALAGGRGAIIVSGHFGNWELMPLYLRSLGFEGEILARPLRYPEYESFLVSMRKRLGINTLSRGSLKDVARLLHSGKIVGMLPDQDTDSLEGIFVDFLGRPAYTPVGPAALSVMTGAPIVPVFNIREGARFRLIVEPALRAPEGLDRRQAIQRLTQAWSSVVCSYIRRFPDHWVWMHPRWKTQPHAASAPAAAAGGGTAAPRFQPVLTVALLGALGLLTGLGGCGKPVAKTDASTTAAADAGVQQMSGFTLTGYQDDGSKKWEMEGEGASADGKIVTIHKPNAVGFDAARTAYLTASAAQVHQDTRQVRLEHDVTIHTNDGLWFFTPVLHWIPDKNEVATDQPVRIETDHMLLRGYGLDGATQLKRAVIASDIEMVLNPSDGDMLEPGKAQQVHITCDGPLSFDYGTGIAVFEQNVHVKDPNGDLYSDRLIAYLDQESHTIKYAEAIGRVRIHQEQNTALSEKAVYEPAIGKITLMGKPSLLIYPEQGGASPQLSFGGGLKPSEPSTSPGS